MRRITIAIIICAATLPTARARAQAMDDRAVDRAAIRADIEQIFRQFISNDGDGLRATHAPEWLGFLEGSRTIIRGIGQYMNFVKPGASPFGMTAYTIRDFDVAFNGNAAFATFIADTEVKSPSGIKHNVLRIADFYVKKDGRWLQSGSNTSTSPEAMAVRLGELEEVTGEDKKQLLAAREAVWRAFFTGDRATLEKLVPAELVVVDPEGQFLTRDTILAQSAALAARGVKLTRLEFPRTEIQAYGNSAFLYSTYAYDLEQGGTRTTHTGSATEVFVVRNGAWVNPGWQLAPTPGKR